jgi:predicted RNA-binding Zn ribbon-like protein
MDGRGDGTVPEAAALVIDFLNTVEHQVEQELFTSAAVAQRWLAEHRLVGASARVTAGDVALLVDVREGLRELLPAHTGEPVGADVVTALDRLLARAPVRVAWDAAATPRLEPAADGAGAAAVARLLDAVRSAGADGSWDRVKVCAKHSCRWAFYDGSRNRSARWCSMAGCGNQEKMRRAYARRTTLPR